MVNITDFVAGTEQVKQVAELLHQAFPCPDGWPTLAAARDEVEELLATDRIARIAVEGNLVLGMIGALPAYNGMCWELHPLMVREGYRGQGLGAALVADLEAEISVRGGGTIYIGSDDTKGETSIGNCELFPGVLKKLQHIENFHGHPYEFYIKQGYEIVGVIPDANGAGKPDIMLAKHIRREK